MLAVWPLFLREHSEDTGNTEKTQDKSAHGEDFNKGPRQAAVLLEGTGGVHLPVYTDSVEAQAFFNQGLSQLHGFWDFGADRELHQCRTNRGFIEEARKKLDYANEHGKRWIEPFADRVKNIKADKKKASKKPHPSPGEARFRLP